MLKLKVSVVFILFIGATVLLGWLLLHHLSKEKNNFNKALFENQVDSFMYTLNGRNIRNEIALKGLEGFFRGSSSVTYSEWLRNLESLDMPKNLPAINWVAYIKEVVEENTATLTEIAKEQGVLNFKIWPKGSPPPYFPILYVFPEKYRGLIGFNIGSLSQENEALNQSLERKDLTTGPALQIESLTQKKSVRMFFTPIINSETQQVEGWVAAAIDLATVLHQTSLGMNISNFEISIYIGDRQTLNNLVYKQDAPTQNPFLYTFKRSFDFGGTQWTCIFKAAATDQAPFSAPSFYIVLLVILVTLAVGFFIYLYYYKKHGGGNCEDVFERQLLRSTQYAFIATDTQGIITFFNPSAEQLLGYSSTEMIGKQTPKVFHDEQEMKQRAEELSKILNREVKPGFEVFIAFAEKNAPENKQWVYIRKDKTRVTVQLSVTALKNDMQETVGYLGVAIDASAVGG